MHKVFTSKNTLHMFFLGIFFLTVRLLFSDISQPTSPATSWYGTRGLSQTYSAESMGSGRLTIGFMQSWYRQKTDKAFAPDIGADVLVSTGAASFGANDYMDIFLAGSGYATRKFITPYTSGLGSVSGGIQAIVPLPQESPLGIGAQVMVLGGTSNNQIDRNSSDGYNYFLTRTDFDFVGLIMQTIKIGTEDLGLKFHFNEGASTTLGQGNGLMLLGAGMEVTLHRMFTTGFEINTRTTLSTMADWVDPLWITPSLQFRSPYYFNVNLGADISLTNERSNNTHSLEKYRIFGGLTFSIDLLAGKRQEALLQSQRDSLQRAEQERRALELEAKTDSLARRAIQDSIALAQSKEEALLNAKNEELRRIALADSMAQRSREDSLALAKAREELEAERAKRTAEEKDLLSTGLLLLDAVYFESGRAEISINSEGYLRVIANMLTKYPKLKIEVSGHTDNIGSLQQNNKLSYARAESVRTFLIRTSPALKNQLTARGYGPLEPKASNATPAGRKINRRVELKVLEIEALKEYNP